MFNELGTHNMQCSLHGILRYSMIQHGMLSVTLVLGRALGEDSLYKKL